MAVTARGVVESSPGGSNNNNNNNNNNSHNNHNNNVTTLAPFTLRISVDNLQAHSAPELVLYNPSTSLDHRQNSALPTSTSINSSGSSTYSNAHHYEHIISKQGRNLHHQQQNQGVTNAAYVPDATLDPPCPRRHTQHVSNTSGSAIRSTAYRHSIALISTSRDTLDVLTAKSMTMSTSVGTTVSHELRRGDSFSSTGTGPSCSSPTQSNNHPDFLVESGHNNRHHQHVVSCRSSTVSSTSSSRSSSDSSSTQDEWFWRRRARRHCHGVLELGLVIIGLIVVSAMIIVHKRGAINGAFWAIGAVTLFIVGSLSCVLLIGSVLAWKRSRTRHTTEHLQK